jgi:hypothetical protein
MALMGELNRSLGSPYEEERTLLERFLLFFFGFFESFRECLLVTGNNSTCFSGPPADSTGEALVSRLFGMVAGASDIATAVQPKVPVA